MANRPGTAQARFEDIKYEWNRATQTVAGTRKQQRAQSAQARSRLQALEAELLQIYRAGANSPGRRGRRGDSALRSPAALPEEQDDFARTQERRESRINKHSLSRDRDRDRDQEERHEAAGLAREIRLPNAVDEDAAENFGPHTHTDGNLNGKPLRRSTLSPLNSKHTSSLAGHQQSWRGNLREQTRRGSLTSVGSRPSSGLLSPKGAQSQRKGSFSEGRPTSAFGSSFGGSVLSRPGSRYAPGEVGVGSLPPALVGGWIAYDDIRQIIKEETKATVQGVSQTSQEDTGLKVFEGRPRSPSILRHPSSPSKPGQAMIVETTEAERRDRKAHEGATEGDREHSPTASPTGTNNLKSPAALGDIPRKFSDGRTNPYFLLRQEMPISLTVFGFGGFSRHSTIRSKCILMLNDTGWQMFFILSAVVNSIYISIQPELDLTSIDATTNMLMEWVDYLFLGIFYLEVVAGCIAYGFRGSSRAWFNRDFFHRLDLFILVVTVYEQTTRYFNLAGFTLLPLRLLRVIKVMTGLQHFASVKAVLITLGDGAGQLAVVFGIFISFTIIFSVFGMGVFRDSFNKYQPCKIYTSLRQSQRPRYPEIRGDTGKYHTCDLETHRSGKPVSQTCSAGQNPQGGFQHFDDISGALFSVFQVSVPDSAYDILHIGLAAEPGASPVIYIYISLISVLQTFMVLGLFVAVVTGTFARVRNRQAKEAKARRAREEARIEAEWAAWDEWTAQNPQGVAEAAGGSKPPSRPSSSRPKPRGSESSTVAGVEYSGGAGDAQVIAQGDEELRLQEEAAEKAGLTRIDAMAARFLGKISTKRICWGTVAFHLVSIFAIVSDMQPMWVFVVSDVACNVIFLGESCLRYAALNGVRGMMHDMTARNELLLILLTAYGHFSGTLLLKLLPVMRIFRLTVFLPTLEDLLSSAVTSSTSLINLLIFVTICLLCAGVTGRYLIEDNMDSATRSNFGSFLSCILTVFQLLIGDSWSGILYAALGSQETVYGQAYSALFVLAWFFTAQLLINNLFVAVIIENFQVSRTLENTRRPGYWSHLRGFANKSWNNFKTLGYVRREGLKLDKEGEIKMKGIQHLSIDVDLDQLVASTSYNLHIQQIVKEVLPSKAVLNAHIKAQKPERILYCMQPGNPIRRFFEVFSRQPLFDTVVFSAIGCSCVFLIITPPYVNLPRGPEDPTTDDPPVPLHIMDMLSQVFTCIFAVEFISRIMAVGLWQTKNAYLKSGWNVMDTIVLVFAVVDELKLFQGGNVAKILRLARALRPLRLMLRNAGMKLLIDALIGTLFPVVYVLLFAVLLSAGFAIVGMGLFRGMLYRCSAPGAEFPAGSVECSGYHVGQEGYMVPRAWVNPDAHFDNIGSALLTLFQLSTLKYINVMQDAMDVTGKGLSPAVNNSQLNSLFFITYLVFGSLFTMNLFVGFIVDGFNSSQGDDSEAEAVYTRLLRAIREFAPRYELYTPPTNKYSRSLRHVTDSRPFVGISMTCVAISVVFMLADHKDPSPIFASILYWQNLVLFWQLVAEVCIVMLAHGPQGWLNDSWKAFDLFVCIGSAAGVVSARKELETIARCFRIFRIIRLMKFIKPIRIILSTLLASIPQLVNIAALLLMFWSMFAVIFVQLYSTTKFGKRLGPTANFQNYPESLVTVYQMVTGDEWMILMNDCAVVWPECTPVFSKQFPEYNYQGPDYEFGDCGNHFASIIFVTFMLFCQSVMLNLFIGMILDNFAFITDEESDEDKYDMDRQPSINQVDQISKIFKRFDFSETGMVPLSILHRILLETPSPLGFNHMFGAAEDAAEKMIRAELNVLIAGRARTLLKQNILSRIARGIVQAMMGGLSTNENVNKSMSFEDFMTTLVWWRKPSRVPKALRVARTKSIPEILAMTQALILRDFLWSWGPSRRRKAEVNRHIRQRRTFFKWSIADPHFSRYRMVKIELNEEAAVRALRNVIYRGISHSFPFFHANILVTPLEEYPETFIKVPESIRDVLGHSFQAPELGIPSFLEMVKGGTSHVLKAHYVLCRFVDARTVTDKKWGEVVMLADFSQVEWDKWETTHRPDVDVFMPQTKALRVDEEPPQWRTVEVKLNKFRVSTILRKRASMTKEQEALRRRTLALQAGRQDHDYDQEFGVFNPRELSSIGSVQAIQSYLVENKSFENGYGVGIRIILGTHPLPPMDARLNALYEIGLQKCEDAVMQVIGYIPKGGADGGREAASPASPHAGDHQAALDGIAKDIESEKNDESAAPSVRHDISDSDDDGTLNPKAQAELHELADMEKDVEGTEKEEGK